MLKRAYATIEVKSIDEDARTITGIATTAATDRVGDIVEPKGAEFKLPIPFLWQHRHGEPIGQVIKAKVTSTGIEVVVQLAKIAEPGLLKDRLDEAWQSIKAGLVRGLSIGFQSIESARIEGTYGLRFMKWLWLELSAVTIPANAEASIQSIKSFDRLQRAASGQSLHGVVRLDSSPGASGSSKPTPKPQEGNDMNIQDQIKQFEAKRAANAAAMDAIMAKSAETGETLDGEQSENYDSLKTENETIDKHLARLRDHEKAVVAKAAAVVVGSQNNDPGEAAKAAARRSGSNVIAVEKKLPPGIAFARYAGIVALAKGSLSDAIVMARDMFPEEKRLHAVLGVHNRIKSDIESGRIMKAAVDIGTTLDSDYAAPLVQYNDMVNEFIEFLRPKTIIGRIPGLRRVPFNIRVPRVLTGGAAGWVGEAKPKPVTGTTLDSVTLKWKKVAAIAVISQELARFSQPNAETLIRDILVGAIVQQMDLDFVDPSNAGTTDIKPASILYGVTPIVSGGDTDDEVRHDIYQLLAAFRAANQSTSDAVWLMSEQNADGLALLTNALGQPAFPSMDSDTPTFRRRPVVTSEAMGENVALIKASEILLADDGQVTVDTSDQATIQMDSAPDDPSTASTVMISLWQRNLLGIRAERFIDWTKARSSSAQYLSGVEWGMETT